ncbi:uncharacterized protein LOC101453047 isoform X2 [Ceratitis capitata]|uniref:uncharacterized protein LOC101453047 isoform X2 n=1 Tax=Ceratitis capitata TaxID=7213 RepID=UPI000A11D94C|nr:uncharacterized protein LOC101453047 isoform X2 [Ceratitis capitata]
MPNYRQKNKKNKSKNRQKNQQQQQQQQQSNKNQNQNQNQNQTQPENQQNNQNRPITGNKDNQSQGHHRREQSNQEHQQQPTKTPKSPITTDNPNLPPRSQARATSPLKPQLPEEPAYTQNAREVDSNNSAITTSTAPSIALEECHNLNSNESNTNSHPTFISAVEREECNRVEDADAQHSKLVRQQTEVEQDRQETGNSEGVPTIRKCGAEETTVACTMGNKESKTFSTSEGDGATLPLPAVTGSLAEAVTTSSGPVRNVNVTGELNATHTGMPKTQMAKVIVHRIVRAPSEEDAAQRNGDIDKVAQVVSVGEATQSDGESKTAEPQKEVEMLSGIERETSAYDELIGRSVRHEEVPSGVHSNAQIQVEPKVILHKIQQVNEGGEVDTVLREPSTIQSDQALGAAKVIVHKIAQDRSDRENAQHVDIQDRTDCAAAKGMFEPNINDNSKVIVHHIQLESTSPTHYRVDSPDALSPTAQLGRAKPNHLLNKSIVQIQELSDESSSEYNDNPPVISEAESETESSAGACSLDYGLTIRTLSPESDDSYELVSKPTSQEQQDHKQRRAQKRVALESHFLPQLLSPRYLDSILEENSDMSDARSDCSENPLMTTHSGDDLHEASASKVRKANEVFPRSNLDFTRRHAKKQLGALPKKPLPIREEPIAMVVAAKLIDASPSTPAQECCTRLSSAHTPESEAAEVIYLSSSASSSLSDLMELDAEAEGDDECGDSGRSTIDLDTDAREIITKPSSETREGCAATADTSDSRESTPVNQASTRLSENNETQKNHANNNGFISERDHCIGVEQITANTITTTTTAAAANGTNIDTDKITNPIEYRIFENLKSLQMLAEPSGAAFGAGIGVGGSGERALSNTTKQTTTVQRISKRTAAPAAATTSESETETEMSSETSTTTTTTTERCEYMRSSGSGSDCIGGDSSSSLTSSSNESKYPPDTLATSDSLNVDPAVLLENIELEMNSVRDILNSHTIETTTTTATCGNGSGNGSGNENGNVNYDNEMRSSELNLMDNGNSACKGSSPSPPPIPPPPTSASASDFHSDFTGFQTQPITQSSPPPPVPPTRATQEPNTLSTSPSATSSAAYNTELKSPQQQKQQDPNTSHSALTTLSLLARQESAESHCSDSTQHSQCTAINVGSRPPTDHELTPPLTANSTISDTPHHHHHQQHQQQQKINEQLEWNYEEGPTQQQKNSQLSAQELADAQQKDASIKKLRLLCTETLASMPYGEQVLVELATVAQNIGELQAKTVERPAPAIGTQDNGHSMPYPLPQLPHISELQLSIADGDRTHQIPVHSAPTVATTASASNTHIVPIKLVDNDPAGATRDLISTNVTAQLLHSPPPPPVPAPPTQYDDAPWLGMPTAADPNVLVCLSPAQQQQLAASNTQRSSHTQVHATVQQAGGVVGVGAGGDRRPDQLLDAHQKFLERRGYHEYSDEQVKSLNAAVQQEEQQILKTAAYMKKLRKSLTPPPPPVPPPPVPAKNAETAAKAQSQQARTTTTTANMFSPLSLASPYVSSGQSQQHQQRAYDAIQDRKANEQYANGVQQQSQVANQSEQKRLLTLIQDASAVADSAAGPTPSSSSSAMLAHQQTSSLENNSRQTSVSAATTTAAATTRQAFAGKPTNQPTANADTRQYSNANASEPTTSQNRTSAAYNSFPTATVGNNMQGVESELAKMFPSMGASDIFNSERKRFSNIESSTSSKAADGAGTPYAQLQSTLPKRYSNIETHSYEAQKRMENGQVIYDYANSRHERQSDGDKSLESASTPSLMHFPVREASKESLLYPLAGDGVSSRSGNSEIMSAIKLNTTENAKTANVQETNAKNEETNAKANVVNMTNFAYPFGATTPSASASATTTSTTTAHQHPSEQRAMDTTTIRREEHIKNSHESGSTLRSEISSGGGVSGNMYEEFRQRAKAAASEPPATAPPLGESNSAHSAFNFQHDKLFKDFDALSQQLNMELEEGKAQRQQREKSASLYDLNRTQWNFKDHFDELKKQRHVHMQELEREIERSVRSRQLKGWASGSTPSVAHTSATGRTYDIPIQIERRNGEHSGVTQANGYAPKVDRSSAPRELTQPRAYNIPIVLENGSAPKVPPPPQADYDTVDDASRFRRAESMFNLSENAHRPQPRAQPATYATYERPQSAAADDWARYASDFGSSENITRPFAREVEICYQRQRPRTIRAPRLSASTNDLSTNSQCYDSYNAYNVRRSHAPMLQPVAQQQRPHHASCYSVLERDPNPTYISTTTRRGVSPAPVSPAAQPNAAAHEPHYTPQAPERQRRASLPREIQEQQLKYISSKEEELRMEFERLQNERRRLMEELSTPTTPTLQMPQHPMREVYRPVPKLPTLTEDEVFRQQMAEEWLSKVAEREERRLQKIIKISKVNETQQGQQPPVPPHSKTDISDEFLKRVHERRNKLSMPADSDWESGAESQPAAAGHASESDVEVPPMKVIEGKSEADLRQLPRHLREFARFSNHNEEKIDGGHRVVHQEEERRQEANANSMSSAVKKSSVVKTVKIARQPEIVMGSSTAARGSRVPPAMEQQRQVHSQQQQQQQQGHSRTTSGGEQVTRRSHISTATSSSTRSSSEKYAKLQHRSSEAAAASGVGGVGDGASDIVGGSVSNTSKQRPTPIIIINADQRQPHQHSHQSQQQQQQHHHHSHNHSHSYKATSHINSSSGRPPAPYARPCKKTRFLLEPNRRSWSESDLLKEIDSELKLAKGFLYANAFERSASTSALYSPAARRRHDTGQPFYKPNEVIFKVKHEYMSEPETEQDRPRKMAQLSRRQVDGIGPVTNDGMPIILRSEVKEPHQHEWYKRLYQTIHKQKSGDDYVIRYKCQRARPQLKSTGYQSEPEPNYDSDYSTVKYRTLDRRRLQSVSSATNVANRNTNTYQDDKLYGTMPNPIKSAQNTYKNQPGRIEDYVTGRSSVSEKERKEWWDEVMDIFNGHLDQAKLSPHYTEGNLSRALAKETGYTSDSNLVFRKRDVPQASPLSPVEQKQAYKSVQAGGEPPLFGFRKPAPERPRDDGNDPPVPPKPSGYRAESPNRYLESDVNIHFKTPIRHEYKQAMSDEDLAQRQAEQMQKLYQEERRRKYLQELQDMNARRHTDNFTPTQKSPIPLNRYDDFQSDLAPKSPNTITTRTAARALYNFQGQNARELSFKKGDIIYIRRQVDRNWYEGEHNAMIGLLPVSYVEVINKDTVRQQPKKPSEGQARAKYNFQAQSGIELSLNKGELVTLTRRVDENWFEGKIANRKGIFPVSYVEVLTDIGAEDIAARTVITEQVSVTNLRPSLDTLRTNINNEFNLITKNGHQPPNGILKETKQHNNKIDALHVDTHSEPLVYRALYKYRPQNSDEMELLEGDIVHVLEICDDGWFVGTSQRTGCFGTFPGNYVERVR